MNAFSNVPPLIVELPGIGNVGLSDAGLAGGMVFTVRDFAEFRRRPRTDPSQPPRSSGLFNWIAQRTIDSFSPPAGVLRYFEWMGLPDEDTRSARGITSLTRIEAQRATAELDAGRLCCLGLVRARSKDPGEFSMNHQALAYGYDRDDSSGRMTLHLYDPNHPGVATELTFDALGKGPLNLEYSTGERTRGFFVTPYAPADPSALFGERPAPVESVPTLKDRPARVDQLGRAVFAESLARRLRWERGNEQSKRGGSFFLHIGGPWGAGKSSILNFLDDDLRGGSAPWIVVTFNAWQHQRTGPPWWSLLNEVYLQSLRQLPLTKRSRLWIREQWWRTRTVGAPAALRFLAIALVLGLAWRAGLLERAIASLGVLGDRAKDMSDMIATATALLGLFGLGRLVGRGSSQAAASFVATAEDPLSAIARHFAELTSSLGSPLALLIDDLDRCREGYVVELLEGIQTLFADASVTFVVAADRHWLRACYEKEYAAFRDVTQEQGRPLGYLFLDKIFQLSADVPLLAPDARDRYWQRLLRTGAGDSERDFAEKRAKAKAMLGAMRSEEQILAEVERVQGDNSPDAVALRQEAALRIATPEVQQRTEHALSALAPLLEPNPRAMKRLVNRYGVERAQRTLEGSAVGTELQLWTIILLRWPLLAEALERRPELLELAGKAKKNGHVPGVAAELIDLLRTAEVQAVLAGAHGVAAMDAEGLRRCVRHGPGPEPARAEG